MELSTESLGDAIVVRLNGNLDTNTSAAAQACLDGVIDGGATQIVVSLEKVDFVSSAGLRVLLATKKKLDGGSLRICGLNETVNEVFEISGFSTILDVFRSESEALQSE